MRLSPLVTTIALALPVLVSDLTAQEKLRPGMAASTVCIETEKGSFFAERVSGGNLVADLAQNKLGSNGVTTKSIANTRVEPLVIEADPMAFLPWLSDLAKDPQKRINCSVLYCDFNGKVATRLVVSNALITRVEFDALDASSKSAVSVRVSLDPERITEDTKGGDAPKVEIGKRKQFSTANFRVSIPGIDTAGVSKVGPLLYTCKVGTDQIGASREPTKRGAMANYENLTIEVAEARAAGFIDWHRATLVEGKRDAAQNKPITIELLGPDLKAVLLKIEVKSAILLAARRPEAGGNEAVRRRSVELAIDSWTVSL